MLKHNYPCSLINLFWNIISQVLFTNLLPDYIIRFNLSELVAQLVECHFWVCAVLNYPGSSPDFTLIFVSLHFTSYCISSLPYSFQQFLHLGDSPVETGRIRYKRYTIVNIFIENGSTSCLELHLSETTNLNSISI